MCNALSWCGHRGSDSKANCFWLVCSHDDTTDHNETTDVHDRRVGDFWKYRSVSRSVHELCCKHQQHDLQELKRFRAKQQKAKRKLAARVTKKRSCLTKEISAFCFVGDSSARVFLSSSYSDSDVNV